MQASALGTPSPPPSRLCSLHATGPAPRHVAITPGATTTTGRANEACGGTRRCASSMTSKVMSEMKSRALRPRSACRITNPKHSPGFVSTLFLFLFLFFVCLRCNFLINYGFLGGFGARIPSQKVRDGEPGTASPTGTCLPPKQIKIRYVYTEPG